MAVHVRVYLLAALAATAVLGIAMGAETQRETFLHPEELGDAGLRDAAGNLVVLTALIPAAAVTTAAFLVASVPRMRRAVPAVIVFATTYLLLVLIQSSWPNYDAVEETRTAQFSITSLVSNGDAVPSVFIGPLAFMLVLVLLLCASMRRLLPPAAMQDTPRGLLQRFMQAYLLGAPFLIILVAGNIRLLISLPGAEAATGAYLFAFPMGALAAAGLLATGAIKAWQLGAFVRNGRLGGAVQEAWQGLRTAEWILAGVLGGLALLATVLSAIPSELLEAGRTFGLTTRGHVQAQLLLLLPLIPWLTMDRRVQAMIDRDHGHAANLDVHADPLVVGGALALALGAAGALITTWMTAGALWPWVAVLTPVTLYALWRLSPTGSLGPAVLLSIVLWGIGNTVTGNFALRENANLTFETSPGVLAFMRVLAVVVIAWAVARLARHHATGLPARLAWPLSILIAAALAMVVFLETSFTAWISPHAQGEYVGIGSLVASQDRAVRTTLHMLGALLGAAAGVAIARIHRPDWFPRGRQPAIHPIPGGSLATPEAPDRPTAAPGQSAT